MELIIDKGKLLIALPTLLDPNFRQAVILLCEHGPEGSLGLVINRPTDVEVSSLVSDYPSLAHAGLIYSGGPVARNAMLVLCRGQQAVDGHDVLDDVFLAKNLDLFIRPGMDQQDLLVRCYLGYAGWSPGQLESEMQSGSWQLMPAESTMIFNTDPTMLWQGMIRKIGGKWAAYAAMPPDPTLN